jgi:hypothetical protein
MPTNRLASSAHTSSPLRTKNSGPGCIPYCWNAASMIAAVAEVGRPGASSVVVLTAPSLNAPTPRPSAGS